MGRPGWLELTDREKSEGRGSGAEQEIMKIHSCPERDERQRWAAMTGYGSILCCKR